MSDSARNGTTKWMTGMIVAIIIGAIGWVIGLTKPSVIKVEDNQSRITTLERRADVTDSNYKHILDRLDKIDKKIGELK